MAATDEKASNVVERAETPEGAHYAAPDGGLSAHGVAEAVSAPLISREDEEASLNFFLASDNDVPDEIVQHVTRGSANIKLVFRPVREDELKRLQRRAAKGERLANGNRSVDLILLYRLILVETMTSPNLRGPEIMSLHGTPEDALKAKILPGEIEKLAENVMELSGFSDDSVIVIKNKEADEVELAKN